MLAKPEGSNQLSGCAMFQSQFLSGDLSEEVTPVPIPNTEVKGLSGDGTAAVGRGRVARCRTYFSPEQEADESLSPAFFCASRGFPFLLVSRRVSPIMGMIVFGRCADFRKQSTWLRNGSICDVPSVRIRKTK